MRPVIAKVLFLALSSTCLLPTSIMAGTIAPSASASHNLFAADLFDIVAAKYKNENVIYSPASIQSCLAMAFTGAGGETAKELSKALKLGLTDKESVAQTYREFLKKNFENRQANGPALKMANRIYVNQELQLNEQFQQSTRDNFNAEAETMNFSNSNQAIEKINAWVAQQTENKIENILQPGSVDGSTSSILINAIYFKGKWKSPFDDHSTSKTAFHLSKSESVQVDMMYQDDKFNYIELPDLNAKALELPYANSELSMLIILPNDVEGLQQLESKLKAKDLNDITSKMQRNDVDVFLPKFRIEFDIDLKQPLKELGLSSMFSDAADFSHLFKSAPNQKISDVKHKAFLDVDEAGSEAAASTYMKIVPMSLNMDQKSFRADHPFIFAIRSKTAVFFAGHVVKF